jgi:hypothetical protein
MRNDPNAKGPIIIPAKSSPKTIGSLSLRNNSAINFAAKSKIPIPMMVSIKRVSDANSSPYMGKLGNIR